MADSLLILYNPDNKDQLQWVFINEQGTPGNANHGKLSELGEVAKGHRTTVLIDSSHVNLTQVNIPSQNRQRQLLAIPYALEDALADDIEELHFAAGKHQTDNHIPVITIHRALLEEIINDFKNAGIFIETLSADALALPLNDKQWTLLLNGNHALIKTAAFTAYYSDLDILPVFLESLINRQDTKPESILVYSSEQQVANIEQLNNIDIEIKSAISDEPSINIFSRNLSTAKQLNILQGAFAPKRESSGLLKPWKSVAAIVIAWICLQLIYAGFQTSQLKDKNTELASLIQKEFKKANPGTKKFNNMRKRMEQSLKEARGDSSSNDEQLFLKLLADAAPALGNNRKITINGIVYRNKFIDLDLQADSLQTLEAVKTRLSATPGLKIVISTSVEKDKVKGRLRLEAQG